MTTTDAWRDAFKEAGALAVTRPDPKKSGLALSAHMPAASLAPAAEKLKAEGFTLLFITTADFSEGFLVTYVFDSFTEHRRMALRVLVKDKSKPELPSIAHVYQGAEWHERESYDFYGVVFTGNPNLVPILLPGDDRIPPPHLKAPDAIASIRTLGFLGEPEWAVDGWELAPEPPKAAAPPAPKAEASGKPPEAGAAGKAAEAKPADGGKEEGK
ncbi:MAG: NADH-quinone oxidoreductase subunit C [Deltaproteobacteria bacterium]|jgi:NADH-quinone oxidoreductase subunit C|nr:NADH-quinone oxidoreductase subunit C [Deltaproteobacteria bacterium]